MVPPDPRPEEHLPLKVEWPVGPQYWEAAQADGVRGWVHFKLASADWYLARLATLFDELARVEHQVGVEMALDGALQSLCSAIDAACGGDIQAAEAQTPPVKPTLPHEYGPERAATCLRTAQRPEAAKAIKDARAVDSEKQPTGWFAQLQRLRNVAVHRSTMPRTHYWGGDLHGQVHVEVPGLGARNPLEYLVEMRAKVERLATLPLVEVDRLTPAGQTIGHLKDNVSVTGATAHAHLDEEGARGRLSP